MKAIQWVFILMLAHATTANAQDSDAFKALSNYYKNVLVGEAFVPTPYGADSRFQPKTIWIYLNEFQASPTKPKRSNAWIAASSGEAIYDSVYAPVHTEAVSLPVRAMDASTKFGMAASLAGTLDPVEVEAAVKLATEKGVDLDLDMGATEVQYVYYIDMLTAQEINSSALGSLNSILAKRFPRESPRRRVVTAALRTKGASVTIKNTSNFDFSVDSTLKAFLSKLGFNFANSRTTTDTLKFDDWRYIAYQSIYTDDKGAVSTGEAAAPLKIEPGNAAPWTENSFGTIFAGGGN